MDKNRKSRFLLFGFTGYLLVIQLFFSKAAVSQENKTTPCSRPEAKQFDFWVGEWDLSWGEDGKGTNHIRKVYDRCVIEENFDGGTSIPLKGMSVSVFNEESGKWQQTWVDNQGGYLDFIGEYQDDRMILSQSFEKDGQEIHQRMVWYNITEDELDWNWERSDDGAKNWKVLWKIHYRRK
jgi:hypothetical protein